MKRFLAWLLLAATILSLCGCATEPAQPETPAETTAVEVPTTEAQPTVPETQAPLLEDPLFLKVSSIMFSIVGETDDIYLGLIPREDVTWESEDPAVVSVENGVLTATGVGTTTIRASYGDRQVTCTAGCLAETQEELDALGFDVLCQPKRMIPDVDLEEPCTYFDNAAIVGDSLTYFLLQWESKTNYLGEIVFLARGGVSMNGFVRRFKNMFYQGKEMNIEDAIAKSEAERVYFLMGSNDIQSRTQRPFLRDNWSILLERVREKSPDIEVVLISGIPMYDKEPKFSQNDAAIQEYNDLMSDYNIWLRQFAEDNGCLFLDLNYYVQDHCGRMPEIYNQGNYHMNEAGCLNWMKVLRYYAQYELEGGTLS